MVLGFGLLVILLMAGCHGGGSSDYRSGNGDGNGYGMTNQETLAAVDTYGDQYAQMLNEGMTITEAMQQLAANMEASRDFSAVEVDGSGRPCDRKG